MQEILVQSLGWEDPLEKGWATHSSILAWRIPYSCIAHGVAESDTTEQLSLSLLFYKEIMVWACRHTCVLGCFSSLLTLQQSHGLKPARLLCPWDFPGKNTGVGCRAPLQGIFPTQGSNPCLLHFPLWQVGSLPLSHLEASEIKITFSKSLYFFISSFLHWLNIS